jgi:hypothetical protein
MPLYDRIDLHAHNRVVVLLNEQNQVLYQRGFANHLSTILEPFAHHQQNLEAAV